MEIQVVNDVFNEALEAVGAEGSAQTFSMEFAQHHEAELEQRITHLRKQNNMQNLGFLMLLAGLVYAFRKGIITIPLTNPANSTFMGLIFLWGLIALNSLLIGMRNRKILDMEKQLLLISVYRKLREKSGI
jgi:hypothetical protein